MIRPSAPPLARAMSSSARLPRLPRARDCAGLLAAALAVAACGGADEQRAPVAREWTDPGQVVAGEWAMYYNAFPSVDLDPAMAAAYAVQPRQRSAVVTVSLARGGDPRAAADADVQIGARTLLGQERKVETRRIARDGVVSWLGELDAGRRETLVFSVRARAPGAASPLVAEFRREFHGDD